MVDYMSKREKKAALIGAGRESLHTIRRAKEQGILVYALDGDRQAPGLSEADYGIVIDIAEEELVIERLREIEPDMILTAPVGRCLLTTGAVNHALGLKGISRQAAMLCVDKYLFHRRLEEEGLRPLTCILIEERTDVKSAAVKLPAILKPRFGSGSRALYYLENEQQLGEALSKTKGCSEDFVLEEVAVGEEYGVDGAVDENGFHLVLLRRKLLTPLPDRQAVGYLSVVPEKERVLVSTANDYIGKISRIMGLTDCLLHADLIVNDADDGAFNLCMVELSARPSGHYLHNRFTPFVTGVDLAEAFIHMQKGEAYSYDPKKVKKAMIRFFDFAGKVIETVPDPKTMEFGQGISLAEWDCRLKPGDELGGVREGRTLMERGYFMLEGETDEALTKAAEDVLNQFRIREMN